MNIRNIANETNPNRLYGGNAQEVQQNNPDVQQEQANNPIQEDTYTPTDEAHRMLEEQQNPEAPGNEQNTRQNVLYEENPNTEQTEQTPIPRGVRTAEEPAERIEENPEQEEQQNRTRQQTETARAANPATANQNRMLDLLA